MAKRVTDIFPPEKTKKETGFKEEQNLSLKTFASDQKKIKIHFKKPLIFILVFIFLTGVFCYFSPFYLWGKTEIEIWPRTRVLSLESELIIDKEAKEKNVPAKIIPGQILKEEKTLIETFQASGKILKETKAEGMIKVYNEDSTSPQVLVATTRFVSADGKIFRTPTMVTIPGGSYQAGKFVPGEIEIKVVADQPGPEYNISPSTFSIPGFAGTDRYTKFYAKSFQAMEGGFSQEVLIVTENDISKAEETLTQKAEKECRESLSNKLRSEEISSKFNYVFGETQTEIIEKFSLAEPEEQEKEFNFQVKAACQVLLFAKKDFDDFTRELVDSRISRGEKIYQESLKADYSLTKADPKAGKMTLSLNIQTKTYPEVDFYELKNALTKRSLSEAKFFLENQSEIIKVEVKFWPFWLERVPEDIERIKIEVRVDP